MRANGHDGRGPFGPVAKRKATHYTCRMIKSFQHKGLERFFKTGTKAGIQPHHAQKLRLQLTALNIAEAPDEMNVPGWRYHTLSGDLSGFYSVTVNGNWRLIFMFNGKNAELVDYKDYH